MKHFVLAVSFAVACMPLLAVEQGDSYKDVIAEKGDPQNRMVAGSKTVMRYADCTVILQEGVVTEVKHGEKTATINGAKPPQPAIVAGRWTTDYAAGLQQAKAENRKVFLFFTGSDWCGWCMKLDREILSTSEFKAFAAEKLVLIKVDFPHNTPQSEQQKAANQKLAEQFGIRGFPTVIVLNGAGKKVGTLGYLEGGPQPFLKALRGM